MAYWYITKRWRLNHELLIKRNLDVKFAAEEPIEGFSAFYNLDIRIPISTLLMAMYE